MRLILKNILERKVNEEPEDQRISIREITISLIEIFPKTGLSLSVKHLAGVWHLELCLNKSDKKGKVKCINPDKHAPKTDHLRLGNSYFSKIGSFVLKVTTVRSTPSESITERSLPLCSRQNLLSSLFFDSEVQSSCSQLRVTLLFWQAATPCCQLWQHTATWCRWNACAVVQSLSWCGMGLICSSF